jgi:hypothetical protein
MKIILCLLLLAQVGQFVPSQTTPMAGPEEFRQINMEWFHKLQNQPGGINPMAPPDSRPGRVSVYS